MTATTSTTTVPASPAPVPAPTTTNSTIKPFKLLKLVTYSDFEDSIFRSLSPRQSHSRPNVTTSSHSLNSHPTPPPTLTPAPILTPVPPSPPPPLRPSASITTSISPSTPTPPSHSQSHYILNQLLTNQKIEALKERHQRELQKEQIENQVEEFRQYKRRHARQGKQLDKNVLEELFGKQEQQFLQENQDQQTIQKPDIQLPIYSDLEWNWEWRNEMEWERQEQKLWHLQKEDKHQQELVDEKNLLSREPNTHLNDIPNLPNLTILNHPDLDTNQLEINRSSLRENVKKELAEELRHLFLYEKYNKNASAKTEKDEKFQKFTETSEKYGGDDKNRNKYKPSYKYNQDLHKQQQFTKLEHLFEDIQNKKQMMVNTTVKVGLDSCEDETTDKGGERMSHSENDSSDESDSLV
eukprot:TRINITY_DN5928_c0_g1_i1.p1 TRINITY_DN5928_c0_g1~~TRINITY_DN5928_c0_g1_i1.p1  ORF type:complete len:410 (+),score=116.01 TRINITY_DN5928_c0_g1_i1:1726-2955(+)